MRAWKEHGLRRAGVLAAELVAAHIEQPAADVITYIPPDGMRQLERGRHPAERLALELGSHWSLDAARLLERTRRRGRQTGLTRAERRANVQGAFVARTAVPRVVLLIDDVYTTGASADAAASALRAAGATRVHVVTFARTVR